MMGHGDIEFWRYEQSGKLKIRSRKTGRWAWFDRSGATIDAGTATPEELSRWHLRAAEAWRQ